MKKTKKLNTELWNKFYRRSSFLKFQDWVNLAENLSRSDQNLEKGFLNVSVGGIHKKKIANWDENKEENYFHPFVQDLKH
jgi:hypothetical protein